MSYQILNVRIDTLELNVKAKLSDNLAAELTQYQDLAKDAETEVPTCWQFRGQTLYIRSHGAGHGWRWILSCPDLHVQMGNGKLNGNIAMLRCSSLFLHACDIGDVLSSIYHFLIDVLGSDQFTLQVRELHRCIDLTGWEMTTEDRERFVTRGGIKDRPEEELVFLPEVTGKGRRISQFDFSKPAHHSCCIYDKTREIKTSRKQWLHEVWLDHGWDGVSKVTRIEFRYDRTCLREMGIDEPYAMLDRLDELWAYSTQKWLRHTIPSGKNQSRWATSALWQAVQTTPLANIGATPAVRDRKVELDAERAMACFVGYATGWAIRTGLTLTTIEADGWGFLMWAYGPVQAYLKDKKETTFIGLMALKADKLGLPLVA